MTAPEPSFVDRMLQATDAAEITQLQADLDAHNCAKGARLVAEITQIIRVLPVPELALLRAEIDARHATMAGAAQHVAAYRRAAMELARERSGDAPLGAAGAIFYGVEAEARVTDRPPDEVAVGDPAATEALEEVARLDVCTHRMRGWLHRHWDQVSDRAETILLVNAIGGGR